MRDGLDIRGWIRVSWLVVAFIIAGIGVGCIWWPASQDISRHHARAMELYDEANGFDSATQRASRLRSAQQRITLDLSQLGGLRSSGAVASAVLQLLHDESKRDAVQIREVAPDESTGTTSGVGIVDKKHPKDLLSGSDVAISVRGPFRNVIAMVADLPRHDVLIDIHDIQLTSLGVDRKPPVLDVTLHSTIYRLVALPSTESSHVRSFR